MLEILHSLSALVSVVIIDIVLAGDNAIVVGMAAAGLPVDQRRRVIAAGILAATVLRFLFAAVTMHLLAIIGLAAAGGLLLLWVAWKMYRELRESAAVVAPAGLDGAAPASRRRNKTSRQALFQIILADLSMSLDNVIAVAGVARAQAEPWIMFVGLALSVALMGVASSYVARLLERWVWLSWVGLGIVTVVAFRLIWDGSTELWQHAAALSLFLS